MSLKLSIYFSVAACLVARDFARAQAPEKRNCETNLKAASSRINRKSKWLFHCNGEEQALAKFQQESDRNRFQGDWAARVENNGKVRGLQTDYHYFGTGTSAAHRMKTR